jgi:hypothetical protein
MSSKNDPHNKKKNAANRAWHHKNRSKILPKMRARYRKRKQEHPRLVKRYYRKHYLRVARQQALYTKQARHRIRLKVIAALGGKCAKCPWTDWRALQVDHVAGGGNKDRKRNKRYNYMTQHKKILREISSGKYQLLCANHNWIKRHENNEFGGKRRLVWD